MARTRFYSALEWRSFWITAVISFSVYVYTLAPNVTLEDSGEFLTAAYHWGVPHPPGYPVWAISANIFERIIPFGNAAWRVNLMSAFYGALSAGMLCLITCKVGARLWMMDRFQNFSLPNVSREAMVQVAGIISGLIFAFIDTMWSQAVIAEVYTLNGFFFTALGLLVLQWFEAPEQKRWPYLIALTFGLGITNHQTLLVSAPAFLFCMYAADRDLCREVALLGGLATGIFAWQSELWFMWPVACFLLYVFAFLTSAGDDPYDLKRTLTLRNFLCLGVTVLWALALVGLAKSATPESATNWIRLCYLSSAAWIVVVFSHPGCWNIRSGGALLFSLLLTSLGIAAFCISIGPETMLLKNWYVPNGMPLKDIFQNFLFLSVVLFILWAALVLADVVFEFERIQGVLWRFLGLLPMIFCGVLTARQILVSNGDFAQILSGAVLTQGIACTFFFWIVYGIFLFVVRQKEFILNLFTWIFAGLSIPALITAWGFLIGSPDNIRSLVAWYIGLVACLTTTILAFSVLFYLLFYEKLSEKSILRQVMPLKLSFIMFVAGSSIYLYMPLSSFTNPPMNWGYTKTLEGFRHHITRGQYERIQTQREMGVLAKQMWRSFVVDLSNNFSTPLTLVGLLPIILIVQSRIDRRRNFFERLKAMGSSGSVVSEFSDWSVAQLDKVSKIVNLPFSVKGLQRRDTNYLIFTFLCLFFMGPVLVYLLNPKFDEQSLFINRVFYSLAHGVYSMWIGLGSVLLIYMVHRMVARKDFFRPISVLAIVASILGLAVRYANSRLNLGIGLDSFVLAIGLGSAALIFIGWLILQNQNRIMLGVFCAFPLIPLAMNWKDSEMRGHDFGWRYGHDMLKDLDKNAVVYGGTDPGRFVPTYMILVEGSQPKKWRWDQDFDRRDLYIITQNALADQTYMHYIRDHYDVTRPKMDQWYHKMLGRNEQYPKEPIVIPGEKEFNEIFNKVVQENQNRPNSGIRFKPDASGVGYRATVEGVEGVFLINGGIAKWIFEMNKHKHTFYVEESYPIAWMFPYLEPAGLIMKINTEPIAQIDPKVVAKDLGDWKKLTEELLANPAFIRDSVARKSFSKLRSSIGGLYAFRNMYAEAEVAFKESIALFPASSEGRARLTELLVIQNRLPEARKNAEEWLSHDPENPAPAESLTRLQQHEKFLRKEQELASLYEYSKDDINFILQFARVLKERNKWLEADRILDEFMNKHLDQGWANIIRFYGESERQDRVEAVLVRVTAKDPQNAIAWINLAAIQATLSKTNESCNSLKHALSLDSNLINTARGDAHFNNVRGSPQFQEIVQP
jgi:tetratricopeptide (TPR) repeat protein